MNISKYSLGLLILILYVSCAQPMAADVPRPEALAGHQHMYVIEHSIPGAAHLTPEELKAISQTSNNVLKSMGSDIKWLHSYVTGDKIYSVYTAPNADMVREHARQGGFPANSVELVAAIIDPSTASK